MELFKKSVIVGVSVTPEIGLEVAQIDFATKTVLKYGCKPLEFDINHREIADLDIFKETLQDLFLELQIPKNAEIVLNIPTVLFKINDYPAAMDEGQVTNAIEEELLEHHLFKNSDPTIDAVWLPNSTFQFNKIAYNAVQKTSLIEITMIIKELGYKLHAIDTSVNSVLNSLILKERVNTDEDTSWILLLVESFCCRIIPMSGKNYVDAFEERISIGEILGDEENYSTVISAVSPILKNIPSKYLCVVSKTNIISAEVLASKLSYTAPIIHQEANTYSREAFMAIGREVDESLAPIISLDIIGAAIYRDFLPESNAHFNLFNKHLGDVYLMEQPPILNIGGKTLVLTHENLVKIFIILAIVILFPSLIAFGVVSNAISNKKTEEEHLQAKNRQIEKFLQDNNTISSNQFDEGDEIRVGLVHNKGIYSYYTIVGTEIPKKLWLTHLKLSENTTIEGQADNLESIYAFFRSIKDYNPNSSIKLQKLGLAASSKNEMYERVSDFDTDSILTSMNADFYEFRISDEPEVVPEEENKTKKDNGSIPKLPNINDIR